jgi:small-conductance mechanosensitive channel
MNNRTRTRQRGAALVFVAALALSAPPVLSAQAPAVQTPTPSPAASPSQVTALLSTSPAQPFTFTYFNRQIVPLRAAVLGRSPVERANGASRALDDLVADQVFGPVEYELFEGGSLIRVGSRVVLAITNADVDALSGETIQNVSTQTVTRLQQAVREAQEARQPTQLVQAALATVGILAVGLVLLWAIHQIQRRLARRLMATAEKTVGQSKLGDIEVLEGLRLIDLERRFVTASTLGLDIIVVYWVLTVGLRQFPYTRPWGESLRGFLLATAQNLGLGVASAIPGLFTAVIILLLTRFLVRLVSLWFTAVERGRVTTTWIYPETAQPTRRLLTALLWAFAIVVAYPYLPGSQTEAFKGVSVFLGLMVTLGSSGLVGQIVSGFTITYSRAIRLGDFVRIGDVEGVVTHLGILSTKLKTLRHEDVTIPNAVVVSQTTTDYSRFGDTEGVYTPTSVTIGYDTPWRQVHAMLLQAAQRTSGLRAKPEPIVLQAGLEDFYVKYTLLACLERQDQRPFVLAALHANIQDVFNEYGVQIMSPNYVLDPAAPKVVPKKDWFASPASR